MKDRKIERFYDEDGRPIARYDSRRPESYEGSRGAIVKAAEERRITPSYANVLLHRLAIQAGKEGDPLKLYGEGLNLVLEQIIDNALDRDRPTKERDILQDAQRHDSPEYRLQKIYEAHGLALKILDKQGETIRRSEKAA